ncbi:hypothetical protein MO973_15105, partial [Paenibacillus sp. TRM 82003]|uniref:hypothetical protein n=1 Tax=Kineococcus sp. TRM81007 TaxID=2925831 RepID=UPI001F56439E
MSTERRPELHTALLAALAGDGEAAHALRTAAPAGDHPAGEPLLPAATSTHARTVAAALTGVPVLAAAADGPGGAGTLVAELLAALAADGRRVLYLAGPATAPAVRAELTGLGLAGLLGAAGSPSAPPAPDEDESGRVRARDGLARHADALHARPDDGGPTPFEALAELTGLRAAHLRPPLLPAAAGWGERRRAQVAALLLDAARPAPAVPVQEPQDPEDADRSFDALDRLPATLGTLTDLTERLTADLGWQPLRTLADAERALALLERAEAAARTYVPLALTADLDQARAVLTQQQRSFLSAEERTRRREVKRLSALRHDGSFGLHDVEELQELRRAWAEHAAGPPTAWTGRPQLAQALGTARTLLTRAATALPGAPQDAGTLELAASRDLADRATAARDALLGRRRRAELSGQGLDELAAVVPAGAGEEDVARLVRAAWLRARAEAALAGPDGDIGALAARFRALDERRARAAAARLGAALDTGAAPRCRVTDGTTGLPAPGEDFDVLVVDDAHRRPLEDVTALAGRVHQLVAVGSANAAGTGDGSAWSALAALLEPTATHLPAAPADPATTALREDVATALRTAGLQVGTGEDVAGSPVDLLVTAGPGTAALAVDLDGSGYRVLPTVRDRDAARPAQVEAAGVAFERLWSADWFRDPRGQVQRITEAWRHAEETDREEAERAAREEAERAAREEA